MKKMCLIIALVISFGFIVPGFARTNQDQAKSQGKSQQAMIKKSSSVAKSSSSSINTQKVNINTASVQQLMTLKGIGETKAKAIKAYVKTHGKFVSVKDLAKVKGISNNIIKHNQKRLVVG